MAPVCISTRCPKACCQIPVLTDSTGTQLSFSGDLLELSEALDDLRARQMTTIQLVVVETQQASVEGTGFVDHRCIVRGNFEDLEQGVLGCSKTAGDRTIPKQPQGLRF